MSAETLNAPSEAGAADLFAAAWPHVGRSGAPSVDREAQASQPAAGRPTDFYLFRS